MRCSASVGMVALLGVGCGLQSPAVDAPADDAREIRAAAHGEDQSAAVAEPVDEEAPSAAVASDEPKRTHTYWADAKPIIDAKCTPCHVQGGFAPMPLTAYEEITPFLRSIAGAVKKGIMPPWTANATLDFFAGDRRLTDGQKETLLSWIAPGAPEGNAGEMPDRVLETATRALERVDLSLQIPRPYTPQLQPDDYRCFVMEWPYDETKYITGISIAPGNRAMVHHAILHHLRAKDAAVARERDDADAGLGYKCFGGPGADVAWLQSYEPGGYAQSLPGDLGFEVRAGSLMVLQIHYNSLHGLAADQTAVELTLEDSVSRVGEVVMIKDPAWAAGGMPIPAGEPDVVFTYRERSWNLAPDRNYGIYWVDLHMHQLGASGRIGIIRAGSPEEVEVLLDIPKWDFHWQETYLLREPYVLAPGDELYVECHFDNTAEHHAMIQSKAHGKARGEVHDEVQGERLQPRDVNWGEGTTDEMCLGNVLVSPLRDAR